MYINSIEKKIIDEYGSIHAAVKAKQLYFRISLIGSCNFKCLFCHNEGGSRGGSLSVSRIRKILKTAQSIGYTRIQFTGGEPLLHDDASEFISVAREYFEDVGITTNGSLLPEKLESIIEAGLSRLHVSIVPTYFEKNSIPPFLTEPLIKALSKEVAVRLNLPIDLLDTEKLKNILHHLETYPFKIRILPLFQTNRIISNIIQEELLCDLNTFLEKEKGKGLLSHVTIRKYREPQGIRCHHCPSKKVCLEYSRSLRLGADYIFRPCLAERKWDRQLNPAELEIQMSQCTLFALDY